MTTLDRNDIQGILIRGYSSLAGARFILLTVNDAGTARKWLLALAENVATAQTRPVSTSLNIAFTSAGLASLGIDTSILRGFSREFQEGIASPVSQQAIGDTGVNSPASWQWGGMGTSPVHILLMLYATDDPTLAPFADSILKTLPEGGVQLAAQPFETVVLVEAKSGNRMEHFGFHDSIAQPCIEGFGRTCDAGTAIAAGEFVLGYKNEYKQFTERPLLDIKQDPTGLLPFDPQGSGMRDLGLNGTYLVFRQLRQDVGLFWNFIAKSAVPLGGVPDDAATVALAAKMVGRWPSGAPLVKAPQSDNPKLASDDTFMYHSADPLGLKCPVGAHIRRNNPRDSLPPLPGTPRSLSINRKHRILRRGRSYGAPVAPSMQIQEILRADPSGERGLHFLCFNANISRQFEFIQQSWSNNPKFNSLYADTDPLVGTRGDGVGRSSDVFTSQSSPIRTQVSGLPQFVTVLGGAYFFLPGIRALRYIASG